MSMCMSTTGGGGMFICKTGFVWINLTVEVRIVRANNTLVRW